MRLFTKLLITGLLFLTPNVNYGQAPTLGTTANYVLFTTNGAMTNSGVPHLTHLTGNVGSNLAGAITGFGNVDGQMHDFDASTAQCATDLGTLYTQLSTATPNFFPSTTLGNGDTLIPGVYQITAAATLSNNLILNGQGSSNSLFIFQIQGTLSVAALSKVKLINGALACNVFWVTEGLVSVATGATLRGTIVAHNAAISLSALDTLEGRALSLNGAVTLNSILAYTPIGCGSTVLTGPAAPALASAGNFAVFSSIGAVTATPITFVNGDVGSNSTTTTGFDPLNVNGTIHTPPDAATASCAGDLTIIYNYLNGLAADIILVDPSNFGFGLVLTPHIYLLGAATTLTDTVYLNAEGDANAVFVIQVNGQFLTGTHSNIKLINGTKAANVYWLINGAVHIYDNSFFNGQIIAAGAITLNTADTFNGRALTINGAVAINGSFVNYNPAPCAGSPITGFAQVCLGSTTTLADIDTGGKWSSSNIAITTIDSMTGVVSGITTGIDTITYTSSIACVSTISMTVNPAASPITGPISVCIGSTITLNDAVTGGKWSSSDTLQAKVDSLTGHVNGIASGTPTITYILPTGCMATRTETVNNLPNAGTISGSNNVCMGATLALIDITSGGTWSSSNSRATVLNGTVTPVSIGTDTIRYTISTSCGIDTATKIITINPLPNTGTITGGSTVCNGSTLVLNDVATGGTWGSSNTKATVSAGTVTPVSTGIDTIFYAVSNVCGKDTAIKIITINTIPYAGIITGGNTVCMGSTLALVDITTGGVWSASNLRATVINGTVTPVSAGTDTIRYVLNTACGTDTATNIITINPLPNAGVIAGGNTVCLSSTLVLTDITTGGTWGTSNTKATVVSGTVTPVSIGIDTIYYAVTNVCGNDTAIKIITINTVTNAGTIIGSNSVCMGTTLALTDVISGGTWSSSNSRATVLNGTVTPVSSGIDTIRYIVSSGCGIDTATKIITINIIQSAGAITGSNSVCMGNNLALIDVTTGGLWSSSNTRATVLNGTVTPVSPGIDTIRYIISSGCGIDTASKIISINPLPNAGSITGATYVCLGFTITLSDSVTGGVWSTNNTNVSLSDSIVTGNFVGIDTINYSVTNVCGTGTATKILTISPLPDAGFITGASTVCVGSTITLSNAVTGGTWSFSNPVATVSVSGIVTGVFAGIDTVRYIDTNICGTDFAQKTITVNPLPNAGTIMGASSVCLGLSITLTDLISGGVWTVSNTNATMIDSIVTANIVGMDTIRYSVFNSCGTGTATKIIVINALPNAGTILGAPNVCVGSTSTLTDVVTGGSWSSSNLNATISNGVVTGINPGGDTIRYVDTNICGTDIAQKFITIIAIPKVDTIVGPSNVCIGATITLTNDSTGGVWKSNNVNDSIIGGVVTGIVTGMDTIKYSITNNCGTDTASKIITINPKPYAGTITGVSDVCVGSVITLTDNITGGTWSSNDINDSVNGGMVTGKSVGTDIIMYLVSNMCGTDTALKVIVINPLPYAGVIIGSTNVCIGSNITLTDLTTGGLWGKSNSAALVSLGIVTGVYAGIDTIRYMITNICGIDTASKIVTVNPLPGVPVISTHSPSSVCSGTLYQNFGASIPPPVGTKYTWSAVNATVWATSHNGQYALISFSNPGNATVTLTSDNVFSNCSSSNIDMVTVETAVAQTPQVIYFQYHFVCLSNNEDFYQWGYDDATTLDSTILVGEINQDYLNVSPDFTNKYYWVMTTMGGCTQKTYLTAPTAIQNINTSAISLDVYPNPSNDFINVNINTSLEGVFELEIVSIAGQKMSMVQTIGHKSVIDLTDITSGIYIVNCYLDGVRITGSRFIKN